MPRNSTIQTGGLHVAYVSQHMSSFWFLLTKTRTAVAAAAGTVEVEAYNTYAANELLRGYRTLVNLNDPSRQPSRQAQGIL